MHPYSKKAKSQSRELQDDYPQFGPWKSHRFFLQPISKQMKVKKEAVNSRHGFSKDISCLIHLTAFDNKTIGFVDREEQWVSLTFNKALNTVSHNIPVSKLEHYGGQSDG